MSLSSAQSKEPGMGPKTKKPRSMAGLVSRYKKTRLDGRVFESVSLRSQQFTLPQIYSARKFFFRTRYCSSARRVPLELSHTHPNHLTQESRASPVSRLS